jgi:hypothetical protein
LVGDSPEHEHDHAEGKDGVGVLEGSAGQHDVSAIDRFHVSQ